MASSGLTSPTFRVDSMGSSSRNRSQSISSDRPSLTGYGGMLSPPSTTLPEPIFIATSAASQIVTNDHDSQSETWFDRHGIEPSGETAMVAPGALKLANNFLDQLLFNFLATSKSTSLGSLRPAVAEVLKPKLAKEAIHLADQELDEYLGGGEDEELLTFHNGIEPSGDWDLELVWKRTRLRCMVYSSLGDMEEEDEDHWIEQDHLDGPPGSNNRYSHNPGVVSPAVAIFLTSILEYMGEQALVVAGQAAFHRVRAKQQKDDRDGISTPRAIADRVVVEDTDMERVALDRTLGRLWRGWKKRIRSPNDSISMGRSFSRDSMRSRTQSRRGSLAGTEPTVAPVNEDSQHDEPMAEIMDHDHAASIPLPMGEDDIREIEIPGLAEQSDEEANDQDEEEGIFTKRRRPKSLMIFSSNAKGLPTPNASQPGSPALLTIRSRKRSHSLPSPAASIYTSPLKRRKSNENADESAETVENKTMEEFGEQSPDDHLEVEEEESEDEENRPPISAVFQSVATGAGATRGEVSQSDIPEDEDEDLEEESSEEPEILNSARISISDPRSLEKQEPYSRSSSIRSHSGHSLRLVDVVSPRSPTVSRHTSVDANDLVRRSSRSDDATSPVLPNSGTPRVSSPVQRGSNASPISRNVSAMSNRLTKSTTEDSISEVEEREPESSNLETQSQVVVAERSLYRDSSATITPIDEQSQYSHDEAKPVEPEAVFAAPTSKSSREASASSAKYISNPYGEQKISGRDSGAPPLTPLREMMENAPDTSDEASSIAPSYDTQSFEAHGVSADMPGAGLSHVIRPASATRARSGTSERAIPRSSPPQPFRDDDATPRPESSNSKTTPRPKHRAGSSSSSIKSHKLRPVRTSEDSVPSATEDKSESFEQLIRSNETIQYTLTPQSMRSIEVNEGSRPPAPAAPVYAATATERPRTSSHTSHTSHASINKQTGLFSNPPPESPHIPASPKVPASPIISTKSVIRPSSKTSSRIRPNAPQARDARVESQSLGDFADFIRSTGPPSMRPDAPLGTALSVVGGVNETPRTANSSAPRATVAPKRANSIATRNRLQAREAVVPYGDASSDLIDFIRQGPPSERTRDNPRIPRTVAPFRTTMDSDQMSGALTSRLSAVQDARNSLASTNISMDPSMHSVNSTSALLGNQTKISKATSQLYNSFDEEEDMMPKRKTRRVKDPYAIDFSDEEDELDSMPAAKPQRREESLIDFLNSMPPPAPTVTSVFDDLPKPATKKTSVPSLMARFTRHGSGPSSPSTVPKANSVSGGSRPTTRSNTGAPQIATHTPITVPYSLDNSFKSNPTPTRGTYASQVDSQRKPTARVAQKSYQPREATQVRVTRTNDLADFLMNTPPPPSNNISRVPSPPAKEEGSFSRMFGRKKKALAA